MAEQETNERDPPSAETIQQLTSDLKNAIFSKYISSYLIDKIDEVNAGTRLGQRRLSTDASDVVNVRTTDREIPSGETFRCSM